MLSVIHASGDRAVGGFYLADLSFLSLYIIEIFGPWRCWYRVLGDAGSDLAVSIMLYLYKHANIARYWTKLSTR